MKKFRKGFTLVELLIVITIIGMLSSMMMIASGEAENSARATKIIEGFRSLSGAMLMFYNEDPTSADKIKTANVIIEGTKKYIKNKDAFGDAAKQQGTYYIEVQGDTWWLNYTLANSSGQINDLIVKKAKDFGLKTAAKAKPSEAVIYDGKANIAYQVR